MASRPLSPDELFSAEQSQTHFSPCSCYYSCNLAKVAVPCSAAPAPDINMGKTGGHRCELAPELMRDSIDKMANLAKLLLFHQSRIWPDATDAFDPAAAL